VRQSGGGADRGWAGQVCGSVVGQHLDSGCARAAMWRELLLNSHTGTILHVGGGALQRVARRWWRSSRHLKTTLTFSSTTLGSSC
jgi:hypothetical protein